MMRDVLIYVTTPGLQTMPFYEYECSACKFYVEALQKISDPPMKKCPSCKKPTLKKLVSAPVFRLKGSGWYETDFKSDQDKKRNLVGDDNDSGSSADAKADAKPAASATDTKGETKAEKAPEKASASRAAKKPPAKAKPKAKPAAKKK
jgi:putative FmdB family regulatory protein